MFACLIRMSGIVRLLGIEPELVGIEVVGDREHDTPTLAALAALLAFATTTLVRRHGGAGRS